MKYLFLFAARAEIGEFVEYDLDNEDEDWLEEFNNERKILSSEKFSLPSGKASYRRYHRNQRSISAVGGRLRKNKKKEKMKREKKKEKKRRNIPSPDPHAARCPLAKNRRRGEGSRQRLQFRPVLAGMGGTYRSVRLLVHGPPAIGRFRQKSTVGG
ncbi:hypothetical protein GW17_00006812 [Ensete ventricosum]|nr:hypothetical protein GW17_00006812 [Ensete ventricosum]RZS08788.1 hypothetical protein BHM03_00039806 [Ensete ventricosum]